MKILITGSDGFVGTEVKALLAKKHTIVDFNKSQGNDILDKATLETKMKGINAVVHLAAIVENTNQNLWEVNVKGTKNVIEAAIKNNVEKFLFLSSTGVYGSPTTAINEKSETNPENNYEKSKLEAERIVLAHQEQIDTYIIRSAMVFGNNSYWKGMFSLLKKDAPLPGNGENSFQVIPITELVRIIELILRKGKAGEIYLAATEEKMTLNEFCSLCKQELKLSPLRMKHVPTVLAIIAGILTRSKTLTSENIRHLNKERNYSITKLKKLGYVQKKSLKKAIQETVS